MLVRRKISARTAVDRLLWTERVQGVRRPALLHEDRGEPGVAAPGREQPVEHVRPEPRVEVVDVGLEHDRGRPARRPTGVAEHAAAPRSAARPGRARRRRRRCGPGTSSGSGPQPVTAAASRAAPVGVHISYGAGPPRTGAPASARMREHGRRRHRDRAVPAAGGAAGADRHRAGGQPFQAERVQAGGDADHVGDRVERADLVEVDVLGVDPVHRGLGPGQPGERVQRGVADRLGQRGRSPAPGRRPRYGGCCSRRSCTSTLTAPIPCRSTADTRSRTGSGADRVDRRLQGLDRYAGVDQRAEQHVAAGAGRAVEPADHRPRPAGHPGREQPGAESVVDVHHDHARARRS